MNVLYFGILEMDSRNAAVEEVHLELHLMDPKLLFTVSLILLNGFFVAAEFSIVKTRSAQLDLEAKKGTAGSKNAKRILERMDTYLAASQLGITLASLLLWWIGEKTMTGYLLLWLDALDIYLPETAIHSIAIALGLGIITALHIVLGEQLPKIIGITYPLKTTLWIADPLVRFNKIFGPFVKLLNWLSNGCARLLGMKPVGEEESHSEEEIRMIITESEEDGKINPNERELIQNVFEFDNNVIRKVMTPVSQIVGIDIDMPLEEQMELIIAEWYSRIPVYEDNINNIIWVVYAKDLFKSIYRRETVDLKWMLRQVQFVPEHRLIIDLLHDFQAKKFHIAIVSDEFGNTLGLVTLEDVLEELVGNIDDEYDEDEWDIVVDNEGNRIIKAHTLMSEINEVVPESLPESERYDTISGYINTIFGYIPQVGEEIVSHGYRITILKSKRQTAELVKLQIDNGALS